MTSAILKRPSRSRPSTFSVVARDPTTHDLGVIVQSKFPAVGSLVPFAAAEVGAIATQAWANVSFGPRGLELLSRGMTATEVLKSLLKDDTKAEHRQVGIVDSYGRAAVHTGSECMQWAGHVIGDGFSCQGNILAGESVVSSMAHAYESTEGDLIDRLFAALKAGQAEGGDRRGMQSAALLVVRKNGGYEGGTDRYVDVRVDDHRSPIEELERVFRIYDMTLLSREPTSALLEIRDDVALRIQEALVRLGYLDRVERFGFSSHAQSALQAYLNYSNFENKARDDGRIWKSVYNYLLEDAAKASAEK
ncbi:MAG: DUF1028 domain-containing protein [Candidatus Thorarchaeota archaeon]|nr:DUF1028 domain-containing protein [Candidatus Thorarchaeota archaeon]